MLKVTFYLIIIFFYSYRVEAKCIHVNQTDTVNVIRYHPATNFLSFSQHIQCFLPPNELKINYMSFVENGRRYDTIKLQIYSNSSEGVINYIKTTGGMHGEPLKVFKNYTAEVGLIDTLYINWQKKRYIISLYKSKLNNENQFSFYYSDTLGIIKLYSFDENLSFEQHSKKMDLLNEILLQIYLNPNYHIGVTNIPRTISTLLVDYGIFKGLRKRRSKKNMDDRFKKSSLPTPCEAGYLNSCY